MFFYMHSMAKFDLDCELFIGSMTIIKSPLAMRIFSLKSYVFMVLRGSWDLSHPKRESYP